MSQHMVTDEHEIALSIAPGWLRLTGNFTGPGVAMDDEHVARCSCGWVDKAYVDEQNWRGQPTVSLCIETKIALHLERVAA